jgi:hypothetical protein
MSLLTASGLFLGYALLCAISFAYIFFQLPETKNRSLEEIAALWPEEKGVISARP